MVVDIDLRVFGGSALTADIEVPKDTLARARSATGIPVTYVPARNTIFLSFALAWAEMLGASDIFIGVNALDYSGYPDCRPEYIAALRAHGQPGHARRGRGRQRLTIHTPLIELTKARDHRSAAWRSASTTGSRRSCYDPDAGRRAPAARCDSCLLRLKGFAEAGVRRPGALRSGCREHEG